STCHWCHVMERESFEDEEIAAYLNENYVLIKVDREERPDIDETYMTAVNLMTGRGGWPMTVWLTPDGKPFFGGTYFPARDGDRGAGSGFLTLAQRLRAAYDAEGDQIAAHADKVAEAIRQASARPAAEQMPGVREMQSAAVAYRQSHDAARGGFSGAPKFPQPSILEFLLRNQRRTQESGTLVMIRRQLDAMAAGGIYDQIGGGFHRYSTDANWLVPHFEKMLYDNAQLVSVYLSAYQVTGIEAYARIARETLDYLAREMQSPEGGFYSATDADSEGVEGKFFVWTPDEIDAVLEPNEAALVKRYYGVTAAGNFEHANILHVAMPLDKAAAAVGVKPDEARAVIDAARRKLYDARLGRVPPHTDAKVIAAWNGLALTAFARGGFVLGEPRYTAQARRTADFLLEKLESDGRLMRIYNNGTASAEGTLEDYAFLAAGFLDLFEAGGDVRDLQAAERLMEALELRFIDAEAGGYFQTPADGEKLIARQKPDNDGALPSGNSVAALNLLRLAEFTSNDEYRKRADAVVKGVSGLLARAPRAAPMMLAALDFRNDLPKEIVIVKPAPGASADALLDKLRAAFVPNRVLVVTAEGAPAEAFSAAVPLVEGKKALEGRATAYVCEKQLCALPTSDPDTFAAQIAQVRKYSEVE
ncbi:MAG: thioredoxin domain-containing protein, partial [Deltaproteobacteria bacterium]|nr:thioredoxin domain-containing protein [Deltaproteobacteria bacterium]